jgi:hypothetical protein
MTINISTFKDSFNGGTRENRFLVEGIIPFGNGSLSQFHIRASFIPPMSTQRLQYEYFGRKAFYPAEKQYGPWSVTVIDDTGKDGNLWQKFQKWHNEINNHTTNISSVPTTASTYKANNWSVHHLDLNGEDKIKTFTMHGCWPKSIEPIQLSMVNPNTLVQFQVLFIFDMVEFLDITSQTGQ